MEISIFGLGYVGCVSAGCLTSFGHDVVGVDINNRKVNEINNGLSPVAEEGLADLIANGVDEERLSATTDPTKAISETELSFVCVGTPEGSDGALDTTNLYNVMDSIAPSVGSEHTVAIRSTVPPQTTRDLRRYLQKKATDQGTPTFVANPEFLREGTAISDFENPPYTIIGSFSNKVTSVEQLYHEMPVNGDIHVVSPEAAELLKLTNNTFHALKIAFANEMGSIASRYGVDGTELLDLVKADSKLNISEAYLNPGFAYGGACLPKDTRATEELAAKQSIDAPLISSIREANQAHIQRIAAVANDTAGETVGIVGISFKQGTHDVRNSPAIELAKLLEKEVAFYISDISLDDFVGSNRSYFDKSMAEVDPSIYEDISKFNNAVDSVVFTNRRDYTDMLDHLGDIPAIDPVGSVSHSRDQFSKYKTISW